MNEKNLAEKIRKMAEICDTETIARALNLPEEVVKGVSELPATLKGRDFQDG